MPTLCRGRRVESSTPMFPMTAGPCSMQTSFPQNGWICRTCPSQLRHRLPKRPSTRGSGSCSGRSGRTPVAMQEPAMQRRRALAAPNCVSWWPWYAASRVPLTPPVRQRMPRCSARCLVTGARVVDAARLAYSCPRRWPPPPFAQSATRRTAQMLGATAKWRLLQCMRVAVVPYQAAAHHRPERSTR